MDLSSRLIEELKIQSERDFKEAENLLKNNGFVEHIAWYCEQSYEKIMKSVYDHFKLKIQNGNVKSVYDKIYNKQHYDSYKLIINMFREIQGSFRQSLSTAVTRIKTESPRISESTTNAMSNFLEDVKIPILNKQLEQKLVDVNSKIEQRISSTNAFKDFLLTSTEQSLKKSIHSFNIGDLVTKTLSQLSIDPRFESNDPMFSQALEIELKNTERHVNFYSFISNSLILAGWLLPHTSMSRYPIWEYDFSNLKPYRERESELRAFFVLMIKEIEKLYPSSKGFIESLYDYKTQGIIST